MEARSFHSCHYLILRAMNRTGPLRQIDLKSNSRNIYYIPRKRFSLEDIIELLVIYVRNYGISPSPFPSSVLTESRTTFRRLLQNVKSFWFLTVDVNVTFGMLFPLNQNQGPLDIVIYITFS